MSRSMYAFIFSWCVSVIPSTMIFGVFFHPRCGMRTQQSSGTAKECSLHSYWVNE